MTEEQALAMWRLGVADGIRAWQPRPPRSWLDWADLEASFAAPEAGS